MLRSAVGRGSSTSAAQWSRTATCPSSYRPLPSYRGYVAVTETTASSSSSQQNETPPLSTGSAKLRRATANTSKSSLPQRPPAWQHQQARKLPSSVTSHAPAKQTPPRVTPAQETSASISPPTSHIDSSKSASPSPEPPNPKDTKRSIRARIKDLYAQLKFLFKFYLNGVKQIYRDRQTLQAIRTQCAQESREMTWGEARLARTHKSDLKKLPLFLAILIIVEEVLPLVVIYAPFLLPSTCILPSQLLKIRHGEEVKRAAAVERLRTSDKVRELMALAGLPGPNKGSSLGGAVSRRIEQQVTDLPALSDEARAELSAAWQNLSDDVLADLNVVFGLPTRFRPARVLRANLERHVGNVMSDDILLHVGKQTTAASQPQSAQLSTMTSTGSDAGSPELSTAVDDADISDEHSRPRDFPQDVPTLSSVASERGLRASEVDGHDMASELRSWTEMTRHLVARRSKAAVGSDASLPSPKFSAVEIAFLPLSLYPPPNLFTPSLVAPKVEGAPRSSVSPDANGKANVDGTPLSTPGSIEAAQARVQDGGILAKSKQVVKEVVEAEERRQKLRQKKKEQEQEQAAKGNVKGQ